MKRFLSKFGLRNSTGAQTGEAQAVLAQIIEEIVAVRREQNTGWEGVKSLKDSARWRALMEEPADAQVSVALVALAKNKRGLGGGGGWDYWLRRDLPFAVARLILQKNQQISVRKTLLNWSTKLRVPTILITSSLSRRFWGPVNDT